MLPGKRWENTGNERSNDIETERSTLKTVVDQPTLLTEGPGTERGDSNNSVDVDQPLCESGSVVRVKSVILNSFRQILSNLAVR